MSESFSSRIFRRQNGDGVARNLEGFGDYRRTTRKNERLEIKLRESGKAELLCRFVLLKIRFPFLLILFSLVYALKVKSEICRLVISKRKKICNAIQN
jgi:hypothetical protein